MAVCYDSPWTTSNQPGGFLPGNAMPVDETTFRGNIFIQPTSVLHRYPTNLYCDDDVRAPMPCRPCMSKASGGTEQRRDRFSIVPSPPGLAWRKRGDGLGAKMRPLVSRTFFFRRPNHVGQWFKPPNFLWASTTARRPVLF